MDYTLYQLLWYFFIYGFLGWCLEIIYAAVRKKAFLNRGILNGPLCPIYGVGMVLSLIFFSPQKDRFVFLAISCAVLATLLEFFTGILMEKLFKKRWWDYSGYKYNLAGYVCLPFSALWGLAAALVIRFVHPFLASLLDRIPVFPGRAVLWLLLFILIIDTISVLGIIFTVQKHNQRIEDLAQSMHQVSSRLGNAIFSWIERRMAAAHPDAPAKQAAEKTALPANVFAAGCGFHKLVWLFFIGSFLGDLTETVFCYLTAGVLMSRSSVVYGRFSIVWGLGIVVLSVMLYRYRDKDDRYIFLFGTVVGGVYEYVCSVFTELVFGTVFWDYSKIPFNIGGRVNLLYCFFWGFAAVIWIKLIYPRLSGLIERIPKKIGIPLTYGMVLFMTINILVSSAALYRYTERSTGSAPANAFESLIDRRFPDARMKKIYPNAKIRK